MARAACLPKLLTLCGPKLNTISKQNVYFWPREGPGKTELSTSSSGALAWKGSKRVGVLASQKHPSGFGREQAEVRALIFMLNPHLALEMLKINFHLHLIFLFVIATVVCSNKEVEEPLGAVHRVQARAQIGRTQMLMNKGDKQEHNWESKSFPRIDRALSALIGERPGSCLCISPSAI